MLLLVAKPIHARACCMRKKSQSKKGKEKKGKKLGVESFNLVKICTLSVFFSSLVLADVVRISR